MAVKRSTNCLGFLMGKCIYTDDVDCNKKPKEACYPPICRDMKFFHDVCHKADADETSDMVYCSAQKKWVNPWETCLKCNPKEDL